MAGADPLAAILGLGDLGLHAALAERAPDAAPARLLRMDFERHVVDLRGIQVVADGSEAKTEVAAPRQEAGHQFFPPHPVDRHDQLPCVRAGEVEQSEPRPSEP